MYNPTVIGVDPGLVHTGIVVLGFNVEQRRLSVDHAVVDGLDAAAAQAEIATITPKSQNILDIFIEEYRPRSGYSVDQEMVVANSTFRSTLGGKLLRNTGVKKVITKELMELCHVWTFGTKTHHQDLRSAARIAILGMMQNPALNTVLYTYCTDATDGRDWNVRVK